MDLKDFAKPHRLSEGELAHLRAVTYYEQLSDEDKKRADKYCSPYWRSIWADKEPTT
jgi:hypothetical protein